MGIKKAFVVTATALTILLDSLEAKAVGPDYVKHRQLREFLKKQKSVQIGGATYHFAAHVHHGKSGRNRAYFAIHKRGPNGPYHGKAGTEYILTCYSTEFPRKTTPQLYNIVCQIDGGKYGRMDAWVDAVYKGIIKAGDSPIIKLLAGQDPLGHAGKPVTGLKKHRNYKEGRRHTDLQFATGKRLRKEYRRKGLYR